ncbi:hypothetical protein TNCV_4426701 [Trichonephila clavipes]|nr:hypothetical protein TNCV_4426701 [Trichonephila clavipes]
MEEVIPVSRLLRHEGQSRFKFILGPGRRKFTGYLGTGGSKFITRKSGRLLPPTASRGIPFRSALPPPAATQKEEKLAGAHRFSGQPPLRSLVLSQHSPTFEFSCYKKKLKHNI